MNPNKIKLPLLLAVLALFLSACSGDIFTPRGWAGVTLDEDVVYLAQNQHVYAVNLSNGSEIWRYPDRGNASKTFFASPSLNADNQQLIAGSYNRILYSLNPTTGIENWMFESQGHLIGSPLATSDRIFVPSADRNLYAIDKSGNEVWRFTTGAALWSEPALSQDETVVYQTSLDHHVYAIDVQSGEEIWRTNLNGAIVGTPTMSEDGRILYIGSFAGEMYAVDAQSGAILWNTAATGWIWSGPALHNNRLYFGDLNGAIFALRADNGQIIWQKEPDGPIAGAPLVTDDTLYFASEAGIVSAFDHNGSSLWSQTVGGKIYNTPMAVDDIILVAPVSTDKILVALNTNGTERWSFIPQR
jgi:eukaryotic-like serine/threonine-protein kinase